MTTKLTPLILISLSAIPKPLHEIVYREVEKALLRLGCKWLGFDESITGPYCSDTKLIYIHNISSSTVSLMYSSYASYDSKIYDHKHKVKDLQMFDAVTEWDNWIKAVREAVALARIPDPVTIKFGGGIAVVHQDKVELSTQFNQIIVTPEQWNCINEALKKLNESK